MEEELHASKSQIEQRIGAPVASFSFPYAFPTGDTDFTVKFRRAAERAGYKCCVTTVLGRAQRRGSSFALPRLPANSDDDRALLAAKLQGAYDWLAYPQALRKRLKRHGTTASVRGIPCGGPSRRDSADPSSGVALP
jgi:hypothetical protein